MKSSGSRAGVSFEGPSRVKSFAEVAQELRRDIRRDLDDQAIQDWVDSTLQQYELRP